MADAQSTGKRWLTRQEGILTSEPSQSALAYLKRWIGNVLRRWLGDLAARPMSLLLTFAVGGMCAFGYSWIPLHAVEERRIERLEAELASQTERAVEATAELAQLRAETLERPDPEALRSLVAENDEQRRKLGKLEDEVAYARKRVRQLESQRNDARKKLATAEADVKRAMRADSITASPAPSATVADGPATAGERPPPEIAVPAPGAEATEVPAAPAARALPEG